MHPRFSLRLSLLRGISVPLVFLLSMAAHADMRIDKAIVYFEPDAPPRQDVNVNNLSSDDLFLEVEVLEVIDPGTEQEQRKLVTDLESIGFIASPAKSVVGPGEKRRVRLLNLREPADSERIYRVTFKPVLPELKAEKMAVKLLVAYQSLVIIRPETVTIDVQAQKDAGELVLTNNGNANVFLQKGKACYRDREECIDLPSKRLYAGNEWRIPNPPNATLSSDELEISYILNSGKKQTSRKF